MDYVTEHIPMCVDKLWSQLGMLHILFQIGWQFLQRTYSEELCYIHTTKAYVCFSGNDYLFLRHLTKSPVTSRNLYRVTSRASNCGKFNETTQA
jgi:hypothetical protein